MKYIIKILPVLMLFAALTACNSSNEEKKILARVGDREITVEEFKLNYEFGWAELKKGKTSEEKKRSYLEYMIYEKLIAKEGYKKGYDKDPYVLANLARLEKDLSIEALIDQEIKPRVVVTPEEIKEAVNKSNTSFKFRYWVEPEYQSAARIGKLMQDYGYTTVVDDILKNMPETGITPSNLESGYITWLDIDENILPAIAGLQIGEISAPVKINNSYYLFQVMDIRRTTFPENDYYNKESTFRNIIFNRKLKKEVVNFVDSLLTPENLTSRGRIVKSLAAGIDEYFRSGKNKEFSFEDFVKAYSDSFATARNIAGYYDSVMVAGKVESFTTGDIIKNLNTDAVSGYYTKKELLGKLHEQIALTARDLRLANYAGEKKYPSGNKYRREIENWKDKWVFETACQDFLEGNEVVTLDESGVEAVRRLVEEGKKLKKDYSIFINQAQLDSIETNDFQKSRWASVQLYKAGVNRSVVPVAAPFWSLSIN